MNVIPLVNKLTLEFGILVPVGIVVLVGSFVRFNKRTGGNRSTGGHFHLTNKRIFYIFAFITSNS